jgi:hypothetical protein
MTSHTAGYSTDIRAAELLDGPPDPPPTGFRRGAETFKPSR